MVPTADREILKSSGVETVKLPARSPNLNAYAERIVRSIKSKCLAQIISLGEWHLRHAVKEYTEHYHVERVRKTPRPGFVSLAKVSGSDSL